MAIRGPKSSATLEIPSLADLRPDARPEPPDDLAEQQAADWRAAMNRGLSSGDASAAKHSVLAAFRQVGKVTTWGRNHRTCIPRISSRKPC